MGRNKAPSEITLRMLCSKAAGMCEFEGCNERLFYDNVTHKDFNHSFAAHIVASDPNGPRGDKYRSALLSDKLENLMLMCAKHHKLIDDHPEEYPEEMLKMMKEKHEKKVEEICKLFHVPETTLIFFTSAIKGKHEVVINKTNAKKATLPNKKPDSEYGIDILVSDHNDYCSKEYWNNCCEKLKEQYYRFLYNPFFQHNKGDFSLFTIAPMPLIIKLGELIGDKVSCDVYQKTRIPDTWEWQADTKTNEFNIKIEKQDLSDNNVALVISLTNDIQYDRVNSVCDYKNIYKIKAERNSVDCIRSIEDLSAFWHTYQMVMEEILNTHGKECVIHLFPSMPVSASFEVGRRYMKGVYPKIIIYDDNEGFFETIKIGEN